jgi:hypothetical protein
LPTVARLSRPTWRSGRKASRGKRLFAAIFDPACNIRQDAEGATVGVAMTAIEAGDRSMARAITGRNHAARS